jgi:hypothetical protein
MIYGIYGMACRRSLRGGHLNRVKRGTKRIMKNKRMKTTVRHEARSSRV